MQMPDIRFRRKSFFSPLCRVCVDLQIRTHGREETLCEMPVYDGKNYRIIPINK